MPAPLMIPTQWRLDNNLWCRRLACRSSRDGRTKKLQSHSRTTAHAPCRCANLAQSAALITLALIRTYGSHAARPDCRNSSHINRLRPFQATITAT